LPLLLDSDPPTQKTVNGVQVHDNSKHAGVLQRQKARYDPENVFSKWFLIIPNADA